MEATPLAETDHPPAAAAERPPFDFFADTFSFPNELVWEYRFDSTTGKGSAFKRMPPSTYAHHCFVVVRSVRQFFLHAIFEPGRPALDANGYDTLIRDVVGRSAQRPSPSSQKVRIAGFANLRSFSQAHPDLLRRGCGGAWQSYVQRGNWRMVLPMGRAHQSQEAAEWRKNILRLPIAHIVTFPRLTINHAVLLFGVDGNNFHAYDPNICDNPLILSYDPARRCFEFPRTHYFAGGRVNAYEIYRGWFF